MDILVFTFSIFAVFLLIAVWFGVVKRSQLPNSSGKREAVRVAGAMAVFSLLMAVLIALNTPLVAMAIIVIVSMLASTPFYRRLVRKMEGAETK